VSGFLPDFPTGNAIQPHQAGQVPVRWFWKNRHLPSLPIPCESIKQIESKPLANHPAKNLKFTFSSSEDPSALNFQPSTLAMHCNRIARNGFALQRVAKLATNASLPW